MAAVLLFCLCGLVCWFSAGVPEVYDVDDVALDAVDHFVQTVDSDAAIGLWAVGVERVDLFTYRATWRISALAEGFHFIFIPLQIVLFQRMR